MCLCRTLDICRTPETSLIRSVGATEVPNFFFCERLYFALPLICASILLSQLCSTDIDTDTGHDTDTPTLI